MNLLKKKKNQCNKEISEIIYEAAKIIPFKFMNE